LRTTARKYIDYINYYALASPSSCIGWKVGLTAPVIQQQFGVHEPVFACLLAQGPRQIGSHLSPRRPDW
jgi:2-keto-4-pentenoate hydratase